MPHNALNPLFFAILLSLSASTNAENNHHASPSQKETNELICDFIYARYYQALTYIQDKLSFATTITENEGKEKLMLENNQFKVYFLKIGNKLLLLELTLKPSHFNQHPPPYFIRSKESIKNTEYDFHCENDTGKAIFHNQKIQSIILQPNFID
ncbi:hypothetical protein [Massilia sp. NR 4-1]|uniref:hypothetical protein n=1 Tax=Massilia sp. NR 4-1 TaxID=1678028 RepID=UPI00123796CD|nr:hypothetical protein [Massilia sp. NR 4-1]